MGVSVCLVAVGNSASVGVRAGVRVGGGVSESVSSSLVDNVTETDSDFDSAKVYDAVSVIVNSNVPEVV